MLNFVISNHNLDVTFTGRMSRITNKKSNVTANIDQNVWQVLRVCVSMCDVWYECYRCAVGVLCVHLG